ncbi:MAG: right-handed parallel beta-helix repeat-containing protein [Candidatus Eisenbacteria bacterium]|nr:right-handed parallel beta-helix repeat-containing protein [Candidatus Eisenbacteria bacterium]
MCGWQNTEFTEGTFAAFEGAVVCVAGEQDEGGGDDDGDQGEGEPDSSLTECDSLPCCPYVAEKPATGRVWVVNDNGDIGTDCDCNDIQTCIDTAAAGDTVCVNPGTYDTLITRPYEMFHEGPPPKFYTSVTTFAVDRDSIVVLGVAGAGYTFVGKDTLTPHVCVLVCDTSAIDASLVAVEIRGFTFEHGYSERISMGEAYGAGGMFCTNAATGSVTVRDCVFQHNRGRHGGALRTYGSPRIVDNVFRNNKCTTGGGTGRPQGSAVFVSHESAPAIENNVFSWNGCEPEDTTRYPGGALVFENSGGVVRGNHFYQNWGSDGGAIYLVGGGTSPTIEFNVFDRCSADVAGGAIATQARDVPQHPVIRNNTFVHNKAAPNKGGAVYSGSGSFQLDFHHNIVACSEGGGVVCDSLGGIVTLSCSDFWMNTGPDISGVPMDSDSVFGLLYEDPLLCLPNPCFLYALHESSPCSPENSGCGLIGALDVCASCTDTIPLCEALIPSAVPGGEAAPGPEPYEPLVLQAVPDPFNASVEIRYFIPAADREIEIRIYDIGGRVVYEFPRIRGSHGWGVVVWTGKSTSGSLASSGTYFLRLTCKGFDPWFKKIASLR